LVKLPGLDIVCINTPQLSACRPDDSCGAVREAHSHRKADWHPLAGHETDEGCRRQGWRYDNCRIRPFAGIRFLSQSKNRSPDGVLGTVNYVLQEWKVDPGLFAKDLKRIALQGGTRTNKIVFYGLQQATLIVSRPRQLLILRFFQILEGLSHIKVVVFLGVVVSGFPIF